MEYIHPPAPANSAVPSTSTSPPISTTPPTSTTRPASTGPSSNSRSDTPEFKFYPLGGAEGQSIEVELDPDMLCETRDLLFCRSTRVWKSVARDGKAEPPKQYAVKQNWQDDLRTPEPVFHQMAAGIEGIPKLVAYQVLDSTRDIYNRVSDSITGWFEFDWEHDEEEGRRKAPMFKKRSADGGLPPVCHRILIRLLFEGVGRPLSEINDPCHLLMAMRSVLRSIIKLRGRRPLHRDISLGKILISDDPSHPGMLIDLGLCQYVPTDEEIAVATANGIKTQPHHHLTGTLPYVAHDILLCNMMRSISVQHSLHHDLESLFWVTLYLCIKIAVVERRLAIAAADGQAGAVSGTSDEDKDAIFWCKDVLAKLESPDITVVKYKKWNILSMLEIRLFGRLAALGPFQLKLRGAFYGGLRGGGAEPVTGKQFDDILGEAIAVLKGPPSVLPVATPPGSPRRGRAESECDVEDEDGSPRTVRRRVLRDPPRTLLANSNWPSPPSC